MPKSTKTTVTTLATAPADDTIQEWLQITKEITRLSEELSHLCERRDGFITQIWAHVNKDPASTVIDADDKTVENPEPKKEQTKKKCSAKPVVKDTAPVETKPAKNKKGPATTVEPNEDEFTAAEASANVTTTTKKTPVLKKKTKPTPTPTPPEELDTSVNTKKPANKKSGAKTDETNVANVANVANVVNVVNVANTSKGKAPTKKIVAPAKGTAKPKLDIDSEDVTQHVEASSEETDLDSLSSVSSESDASEGENN